MKLGKLLSAGKSFLGGKQVVSYRLNRLSLPKFNEGKNPFLPKAPTESAVPTVANANTPAKPPAVRLITPTA
ncbi:MAG TPA: hypothetical protein VF988_06380, partial [Verrucomicrobiae bacterium]